MAESKQNEVYRAQVQEEIDDLNVRVIDLADFHGRKMKAIEEHQQAINALHKSTFEIGKRIAVLEILIARLQEELSTDASTTTEQQPR